MTVPTPAGDDDDTRPEGDTTEMTTLSQQLAAEYDRLVDQFRKAYGDYRPFVTFDAPLRPRPAARGDKVKVTVEGYVDDIAADGRVFITETRRPFPGEYETGTLVIESTQAGVTVVERAPAAPKVGDTITGATLKATPWRRGTIIRGQSGRQYVLHADGRWHALDDRDAVPFYATGDDAVFVVEHAPGK